jgi:UDP-3-O-[3-hydroxymyristoyl] glucosamine N-acyltransferase
MISSQIIEGVTGLKAANPCEFHTLGLVNSSIPNTLSFLDQEKYVLEAKQNMNLSGLFVLPSLRHLFVDTKKHIFLSDDPRFDFYTLQNKLSELDEMINRLDSEIDSSAQVHATAYVSPFNVKIGKGVIVHPKAVILSGVEIGENTIIRSGAVIGDEGFEHKKTSRGILTVKHDGKVIIGQNVDIGVNTAVAKGFAYRPTIIGDDTKIDNLIHIAHGVQIGKRCLLPASCMIGGSSTLEDDVWIGPNASVSSQITIGEGAYVTLGSVVTKNVVKGEKVTGNFAIPHIQFLRNLKRSISE